MALEDQWVSKLGFRDGNSLRPENTRFMTGSFAYFLSRGSLQLLGITISSRQYAISLSSSFG
jgi:hypothetical protein